MAIKHKYKVGDLIYYKHPMNNFSVFGRILSINSGGYVISWSIGNITDNSFSDIDNDMCTRIASSTEQVLYDQK